MLNPKVLRGMRDGGVGVSAGLPSDFSSVRDNTRYVGGQIVPLNKEKESYYNPKVIKGMRSGNGAVDFLYNNQWLMDVPVVGSGIKKAAKHVASNSGGSPTVRDSFMDNGVNYAGTFQYAEDIPAGPNWSGINLIDVYFGDQSLPASRYRPSSDYMSFLPSYSVKGRFDSDEGYTKGFKDVINKTISYIDDYDKKYSSMVSGGDPIYIGSTEASPIGYHLGLDLGAHKTGIGYDKEVGLPYLSVSDAWDFEPGAYHKKWGDKETRETAYIQSSLMHKAGKPFKIYDRFYFDPDTREYISDSEIEKKRGGPQKDTRPVRPVVR